MTGIEASNVTIAPGRQLLTIDLQGLKPALIAAAARTGTQPSSFVRELLARELQRDSSRAMEPPKELAPGPRDTSRLAFRLPRADAMDVKAAARRSGLSLGAYVLALMRRTAVPDAGERRARLEALTRTNAELAQLRRNVARLAELLRQGSVRAAQEYAGMLDAIGPEVREHLAVAAAALEDARA
jgi:hypothetical protein